MRRPSLQSQLNEAGLRLDVGEGAGVDWEPDLPETAW